MKAESNQKASRASPKKRRSYGPASEGTLVTVSGAQEKRGRRRGKLAGLMDLPLDVLFEIFGHLRPFDLLRLARSTKDLRRLLMKKGSVSVWRRVLQNVPGLPSRPPELSEPQWVNLVFDPHCHFCLTTGVRNVEWRFRFRICSKCAKELMQPSSSDSIVFSSGCLSIFVLDNLLPSRLLTGSKHQKREFLKEDQRKFKEDYAALSDDEARLAFIQEKQKMMSQVDQHALVCELWARSQTNCRIEELDALKEERRVAIIKKLESLGWSKDLESIRAPDSLTNLDVVRKPQRLTERVWAHIEPVLIRFMETMRVKRLAREHAKLVLERMHVAAKVLRTYKNARLPTTEVLPELVDFCAFPPIKDVLEQPTEVTVDEDSFSGVLCLIPGLIKEWQNRITAELARAIHAQGMDARARISFHTFFGSWFPEDDDEDCFDDDAEVIPRSLADVMEKIKLATSTFQCRRCSWGGTDNDLDDDFDDEFEGSHVGSAEPLFFPRVLGHSCLTRDARLPWILVDADVAPAARLEFPYGATRRKWTPAPLKFNHAFSKCIASIVTAAGLDPEKTTAEEMNVLNGRFVCLHCEEFRNDNTSRATAFSWRDAAVHHMEVHRHLNSDWLMLGGYDAGEHGRGVPLVTDMDVLPLYIPKDKFWSCVHCRDLPSELPPHELQTIKAHLSLKHNIYESEIDRDYFRNFEAEPISVRPACVTFPWMVM